MTDDELRRLEELSAKAAKGPWSTEETVEYCGRFARNSLYLIAGDRHKAILYNHLAEDKAAAEYIVAACNAVPELIAELKRERAKVRYLAGRLECEGTIFTEDWWVKMAEKATKEAGE